MDTLLPGISAERVPTSRLTVNVLSVTGRTGPAVLFVHGNVSSSLFWQPMMLALLDIFVESMLSTRTGEYWYPGDSRPVDAWPGFAPGDRGVLNTMAPTHFRIADLSGVEPRPPVLWLRGADDVIVSDTSLYDLAYLGSIGAIPGWPGEQSWPPQPMVAQTRAVLNGYAVAGGRYREVVIEDAGHGPHLDQPERFLAELTDHLATA
jgi:pimeloyl-ACP methyl ester carboxylesterase